MSDQLKMHSPNLVDSNIAKIAALFPNCVTESQGENGELKKAVDFDLLKQELSQVLVEGEQERYRLDWVGKKESILTANAPIAKTLRPCRDESVNFDKTENLFIEGDNLEALKLLQENYLGKVKMIYIDPPYNTGNDFIYEDDFAESTDEFFERSNQVDEEGNKLVANTDSNGRFHSDWLSMMYSRLKLARNLLTENGVIVASIDDNEINSLKNLFNEIFGENNFLAQIVWEKIYTTKNDSAQFSNSHEYLLIFAKNISLLEMNLLPRTAEMDARYTNPDNDPRGPWKAIPLYAKGERKNGRYEVVSPAGKRHLPGPDSHWLYSKSDTEKYIADNRIYFGKDGTAQPNVKRFLSEVQQGTKAKSIWFHKEVGSNDSAKRELKSIYGLDVPFDFPKPTTLINRLLHLFTSSKNGDLILDFFAGSGTTGHAVLNRNIKDNGNRKFILIQLDDEIGTNAKAKEQGFKKLSEIAIDRLRKVISTIDDKKEIGFRVLKIDSTNMKDVYYTPDAYKQVDILDLADHIKEDRTSEDLLFQVMLDWGLELSLPIERKIIQGKEVFYVAGNSLVACFDEINFAMVDEIAQDKPLRVVSAERAIQLDHDKTNIKERFKQLSPETEVKFI